MALPILHDHIVTLLLSCIWKVSCTMFEKKKYHVPLRKQSWNHSRNMLLKIYLSGVLHYILSSNTVLLLNNKNLWNRIKY